MFFSEDVFSNDILSEGINDSSCVVFVLLGLNLNSEKISFVSSSFEFLYILYNVYPAKEVPKNVPIPNKANT